MSKKYKTGISLSGGGSKGFAHLGVLQALNEKGIYPDVIAGTSAGAFAGVFYADGYTPIEILSFFDKKSFSEFAKFIIPNGGIFRSTPFKTFLEKHLKSKKFEELKIPLNVITTNIETGAIKVFNKGPLIPAIMASCSVPIVFTPVKINNEYYVDGGIVKKLPVSIIRKDCDNVIGVSLNPFNKTKYKNSLIYIAERSFHFMSSSNTLQDRKLCDYFIEVTSKEILEYSMFDLKHTQDIFNFGYEAAQKYMKHNKNMAGNLKITSVED